MRKFAIVIAFSIIYLSSVPGLLVSDISTWYNQPMYTDWSILDELKPGGVFYQPWSNAQHLEFYLRKIGHFVFYGLLTFFTFWKTTNMRSFFIKLFLVCSFAFIDELHQLFVIGRSGRLMDVCFDIFSVLAVLTFMILSGYVWTKGNRLKKVKKSNTL